MAIPLFVKVSPQVARKMQLDGLRFKTADGNYLLRQSDFMIFGPVFRLAEYAARVGGVVLRDAEAAANQRGEVNTPLPVPEDPEFIEPASPEVQATGDPRPDVTVGDAPEGVDQENTAGEGDGDE